MQTQVRRRNDMHIRNEIDYRHTQADVEPYRDRKRQGTWDEEPNNKSKAQREEIAKK